MRQEVDRLRQHECKSSKELIRENNESELPLRGFCPQKRIARHSPFFQLMTQNFHCYFEAFRNLHLSAVLSATQTLEPRHCWKQTESESPGDACRVVWQRVVRDRRSAGLARRLKTIVGNKVGGVGGGVKSRTQTLRQFPVSWPSLKLGLISLLHAEWKSEKPPPPPRQTPVTPPASHYANSPGKFCLRHQQLNHIRQQSVRNMITKHILCE